MGIVALTASYFLLHEDLSLIGSLVALATVAALLAAVITSGVTVSAMVNNTVVAIAVLWIVLYGAGFALSLLPTHYPSPDRIVGSLPAVLRGFYDLTALGRIAGYSALFSLVTALVGLISFSRRDV
jgi:hypothetical protein